jgi:hypothetical protein
MIYAKSLSVGDRVATIKLEGMSNPSVTNIELRTELNAIYALLGGYNEVARGVDVDEFHEIQKRFKGTIWEMAQKLREVE